MNVEIRVFPLGLAENSDLVLCNGQDREIEAYSVMVVDTDIHDANKNVIEEHDLPADQLAMFELCANLTDKYGVEAHDMSELV